MKPDSLLDFDRPRMLQQLAERIEETQSTIAWYDEPHMCGSPELQTERRFLENQMVIMQALRILLIAAMGRA